MTLSLLLILISLVFSSTARAAADRQPPVLPHRHHAQARINEEERNRPVGQRLPVARNLAQEVGYDEQAAHEMAVELTQYTPPQSPDRQHNHNNHENQQA